MECSELFMDMRRLRHLRRCNNKPTIFNEDVAQHTYYTTMLAKLFYDEIGAEYKHKLNLGTLLSKCLLHDMEETFISDIPYNVKHKSKEFNEHLNAVVDSGMRDMMGDSVSCHWNYQRVVCKDGIEGDVVSLCDMLELGIYASEEVNMGNKYLTGILDNCRMYMPSLLNEVCNKIFDASFTHDLLKSKCPEFYKIYLAVDGNSSDELIFSVTDFT